jgi:mannose-1-phosphate guanylyltransferase
VRAFLLAAGEGQRLRPLTSSVPKCLVPIAGTPLLALWLDLLERHGISDVLINLHHLPDRVLAFVAAHSSPVRVHTVYEPRLLGSAGTVLANASFVERERDFLILYADNLTDANLSALIAHHRAHGETMTVGVVPTDRPHEKGILVAGADGRVEEFVEKPAVPRSNLSNAGIYVAGPRLFHYLRASPQTDDVLDFGHHVLPRMPPDLGACAIADFLLDIGTPQNYEAAQRQWPLRATVLAGTRFSERDRCST